MENLIIETAKQVPALGMLGVIVWVFLNHLAKQSELLRDLHREHLTERAEMRVIIKENTDSNQELIRVITNLKLK